MNFRPEVFHHSSEHIKPLGLKLNKLVADSLSIDEHKLNPETDIDFIPFVLHNSAIAPPISFEIETIGFPLRKEKVTKAVMFDLKIDFIAALTECDIKIDPETPLIWLKYIDPDGVHI